MKNRLFNLSGLTPRQIALASAVFIVTALGALLAIWVMRRWNRRTSISAR
jgi:hypothetical protein